MQSKVLSNTWLSDTTFVLRIERNGLEFRAGQYVVLGFPGERISREYSIYSSERDPYIDLLIKEVDQGEMTPRLKQLMPDDLLTIDGPFGFFVMPDLVIHERQPVVFVATGTGISPFRSFILSYPDIEYTLLHGIRHLSETYHMHDYDPARYIPCVSSGEGYGFRGRVTDYLSHNEINTNAFYYLCGNSAMVDEVIDILEERGISPDRIKTEIFF
jgi:ferredoxin/flavodoxin---NADP+ reductase